MKSVLFKAIAITAIIVMIVGMTVAFYFLIKSYSNRTKENLKEYLEDKGDRFVEVTCEWHRGSAWVIMQDTETDKQYLWVGGSTLTPMENNNENNSN